MKAAAFLNLPMQPRGPRIVDLHPINPQIMFLCDWVFRMDQRERDEWPAVFVPSRKHRQLIESHRWFDDLRHRPTGNVASSEFQELAREGSMFPKFRPVRREQRLSNVHQFFDKP